MRHVHALFLAGTMAATAVAGRGAAPAEGPAGGAPAAVSTNDARWTDLARKLADENPEQRNAAQQELEKANWRNLPALERVVTAVADPEAKARLSERIAAIHEDLAINPPPLTVHFHQASLQEVAAVLGKQLDTRIEIFPEPIPALDIGSFTLDATDTPFWGIFLQLSRQHPLQIETGLSTKGTMRLVTNGAGWRTGVLAGPLLIVPQTITRSRTLDFQDDGTPPLEVMRMTCLWAVDPRVKVAQMGSMGFSSIVDDAGKNLLPEAAPDGRVVFSNVTMRTVYTNANMALLVPEKREARIASAKGFVQMAVALQNAQVEVADPGAKIGDSIPVGGHTIQITSFKYLDTAQPRVDFHLDLDGGPMAAPARGPVGAPPRAASSASGTRVEVTTIDATGREISHAAFSAGGFTASLGGFTAPVKLRFNLASKTKEVKIPFEFKDLPLP